MPNLPAGSRSEAWTPPVPSLWVSRSGYNSKATIIDRGGSQSGWRAEVTVVPGNDAHAAAWRGWVAQMRGPVGTADMTPLATPQIATTDLFTIGAIVSTSRITVTGANVGQIDALPAGTLATIYQSAGAVARLVVMTTVVTVAGANRTFSFDPPFPGIVTAATAVLFRLPIARMRLASAPPGFEVSPGGIYQPSSFTMEEAL